MTPTPGNLVQVRDARSLDDLGLHELPWPNAEIGDIVEIDETTCHVVDVVPAKIDAPVVAIIAVEPVALLCVQPNE